MKVKKAFKNKYISANLYIKKEPGQNQNHNPDAVHGCFSLGPIHQARRVKHNGQKLPIHELL